ncbi:16274_t:CDS:2, partial [Funneliformis caledonium]
RLYVPSHIIIKGWVRNYQLPSSNIALDIANYHLDPTKSTTNPDPTWEPLAGTSIITWHPILHVVGVVPEDDWLGNLTHYPTTTILIRTFVKENSEPKTPYVDYNTDREYTDSEDDGTVALLKKLKKYVVLILMFEKYPVDSKQDRFINLKNRSRYEDEEVENYCEKFESYITETFEELNIEHFTRYSSNYKLGEWIIQLSCLTPIQLR